MSDPVGTVYVVRALGKRLLTTQDKAAADALANSIKADGVKVKVEKYPPKAR